MRKLLFVMIILAMSFQVWAQSRTVLIEYGTGTWCSYCPRGSYYGHEVQQAHPGQVLIVALHSNDTMEMSNSTYMSSTGIGGLPSGDVDRVQIETDPTSWPSMVTARLNQTPEAQVSVTRTYDAATRVLSVTVSATPNSNLSGTYKLGGILIEDCIHGSSSDFAQSNSYSGSGSLGIYSTLPNPIPASMMVYDHVARDLIAPYAGQANSLPASMQSGQTYSETFTYTLPAHWNEEYVRVYGYMTNSSGDIVNAGASPYAVGDDNAKPIFHSDTAFMISENTAFTLDVLAHDPDNENLTITAVSPLSWLNVQAAGNNDATLTGTAPAAGTYTLELQVSDGSHTTTQSFSIEVISSSSQWVDIGNPGFSSSAPKYDMHTAIYKAGNTLYTIGVDDNKNAFVYMFANGGWTQLGSTFYGIDKLGFGIAVDQSSGEPWIGLVNDNTSVLEIKKYSGGNWTNVGSSITNGSGDIEIAFTSNGTAYLSFKEANGGDAKAFKYDGSGWVDINFPTTTYLAWNRMAINSNDQPVVLAAEFSGYTGYSRALTYNGSSWDNLGGLINSSEYTSGSSSSLHQLATGPNGELYAAIAHSGGTTIYSYDNGSWTTLEQYIDGGISESFDIQVNSSGDLYVVYQNSSSKLTCEKWNGTTWSPVGAPGFSSTINGVEMVIHAGDMPAVVYQDLSQGGKLSALGYGFVVGIDEQEANKQQKLHVYPNPCSDHLYIQGVKQNTPVYIYSLQGKLMWQGTANKHQRISLEGLQKGMYIIQTQYGLSKFIIQ